MCPDLPSKFGDQDADHEGAEQPPDGKDGHGERVHERQRLLAHARAIAAYDGAVVEVFNVLQERDQDMLKNVS